ncbi:hypothetical protein GNI_102540 [Gregarina niphandrodes]|uniref:Uncharacterized protein n=1 Tax=Gregarina niphandrodes TaxID=110365 RepID=A0A023B4D8_GRENI|nr:hypothetical protein GNI_102540 [Gregarina niphandrodes]EZG56637.1 hypothetical protein GNI_102540 [Gregarina niphandrodes]|eukprot:XP_011131217.1 hypothetical protein GNI_102540 [Gregarina niphandrodes]
MNSNLGELAGSILGEVNAIHPGVRAERGKAGRACGVIGGRGFSAGTVTPPEVQVDVFP